MSALARGFIVQLTPKEVLVGTDHALDLESIKARLAVSANNNQAGTRVMFRIDKDELFGGMGRRMFYMDGDVRRLQLVVDLKPPRFYEEQHEIRTVNDSSVKLNEVQRRAVAKVLNARDYALILGMPGTGKTIIAWAA